jgi:hypothetical protein
LDRPSSARAGHPGTLHRERVAALWTSPAPDRAIAHLLELHVAPGRPRQETDFLLASLLAKGTAKGWSRKELVRQSGLTWGTFHRALSGDLDFIRWLPRLRSAAERLGA